MTTNNFRSVEERTVEASRIAREACENAYREGFEAGAKEMQKRCAREAADYWDATDPHDVIRTADTIATNIRNLPLPTPTTKGGA